MQTIPEAACRTVTAAALHPVYAGLAARFTPGEPPSGRALLPNEARLRTALATLSLVVAEHHPVVVDGWVICAGCARGVTPGGHLAAMFADAIYPCPTIRDIVGDHGYGLVVRDTDWAAANAAMLRATGHSDTQIRQAAVLAAARAEDAPIWAGLAECWPTGTNPDEQETPS